jgi:Tfp pilus assembly protein PilE
MTKLGKGILIAAVAVVVLLAIAIGVVVGVSMYRWKDVVRRGNETAAVQNLSTISVGQARYYTENANYATFDQLVEAAFLSSKFAGDAPVIDGYIYVLALKKATADQKPSFTVSASPESSATGTRHFFIDDTSSSVRSNPNQPASAHDPPYRK